ncbi:ABC transporter ATP-binding protein [Paenibacillus glufosinatiresistens]|uniref:ABC transporter ATP-binding protein n=1 Tax=Paenibacillus glufosinatiresistens TaxID=3070657 RepID=UPI00286D9D24|nr:ATP-binding cassette domain-containing protein [Paenibacillus sp. YX.27]
MSSLVPNKIPAAGLAVRGFTVSYPGRAEAVGPIALSVPQGAICSVIGPSGCGKSTLLRAAAGLLGAYEGEIAFGGQPLAGSGAVIGLVPQNYGLLPWKTAEANITTALGIARPGLGRREKREAAARWLGLMGIGELADRYPARMSGGQQQRVAVARAFALEPDLLLLDEPFSALDALTREALQERFLANWAAHPATALFVTHDVEEAILLGGIIAVLPPSGAGSPLLLDNPVAGLVPGERRTSAVFFEMTRTVRKAMADLW